MRKREIHWLNRSQRVRQREVKMRTADPDTGQERGHRRPGSQGWRPRQRLAPGHRRSHDGALARDERSTYRSSHIRVGVHGDLAVHRLGLVALIDELDVASAHDATEAESPAPDVLVVAGPPDATALPRATRGRETPDGHVEHPVPMIVATADAVSGRDVLRWLSGPVRGVVTLAAPAATWACAIAGVAAGGYSVDPTLTRELVLLAAVGTRYGPRPLGLTAQQQRILDLVATSMSNRAIAAELGISPETVKTHLTAAMHHLNAADRVDAAQRLAAARGVEG